MNPHNVKSTSLSALAQSIWCHRRLIFQMTKREVVGRYKGSIIGMAWSFFIPVLLLAIYTFVFSVVFKARFGNGPDSKSQFAIVLFVGLIVHGLLAEVLSRAPSLIQSNVNYVKKVVFPLEILPVIAIGSALFNSFVSTIVLLIALLIVSGTLHFTVFLAPIVCIPFLFLLLGFSLMLASVGVFIRDVGQIIGVAMMVLLFASPVFYPISSMPEQYRFLIMLNPISFIIEQERAVLIWGHTPDWIGLLVYSVVAFIIAWAGFVWFQKTRKGFADVL